MILILEIMSIVFLVLVVVFVTRTIEEVKKKNNRKISFRESMNLTELPVVTFYNKDRKLNFLLDTGSNISHINKSSLPSLEYEKTNTQAETMGFEGNKVNSEFCKMTIYYKDQKFEEEFSITDLDGAFDIIKKENGVQIHGILGSKFFEKYKYILDFKELIAYIK